MSLPQLCLYPPVLAFLHHGMRQPAFLRHCTAHLWPIPVEGIIFSITCPVVLYLIFAPVWIWGFVAIPFVGPLFCSPLFHHLLKQAPGLAEEARCVPVIKVAYLVADSESHPRLGPALKEKRQKEVTNQLRIEKGAVCRSQISHHDGLDCSSPSYNHLPFTRAYKSAGLL